MLVRRMMAAGALLGAATLYAQEATLPPSADEVKRLADRGEYREALKGLARALALKGPAAAAYDRVELLTLRGECQLQIRETKAALESLDAAYKEALQARRDDGGPALALAALVQNSTSMKYTPKTKTGPLAPKAIDILDRKARPQAYAALFDDQLAAIKKKVAAAQMARTMVPILEAAKSTATLRALEKAGKGDTTQSKALADDLSTQAAMLLSSSVNEMTFRTEGIITFANEIVTVSIARYDQVSGRSWMDQMRKRRGLSTDDTKALKGVQQTCTQVIAAANELAVTLSAHADTYKEIAAGATQVGQKATTALNTNYDTYLN